MDRINATPLGLIALAVVAVAGCLYSVSGYAMAGAFSVSNPERLTHWQRVAGGYLTLAVISAAIAAASLVAIFRRARR